MPGVGAATGAAVSEEELALGALAGVPGTTPGNHIHCTATVPQTEPSNTKAWSGIPHFTFRRRKTSRRPAAKPGGAGW